MLDALGIPRLSLRGYEADDLIATLATQAAASGMHVLIVTGDRDALQLVSDDVTVLMTRRAASATCPASRRNSTSVIEKYGLTPAQYPDFAATSRRPELSNLPGIPGVGEKTASKWVAEFGSLAQLVDRVGEVKGRAGDNLREHLASVLQNRQLTELVRDVTLDVGPDDLIPVPWDRDQIHQLFDTLQFRVLRDRLYSTLPNGILGQLAPPPPATDGAGFDVDLARLGPDEVAAWLAGPGRSGRIGLAVSGTWGRGTGDADGLAAWPSAAGPAPILGPKAPGLAATAPRRRLGRRRLCRSDQAIHRG